MEESNRTFDEAGLLEKLIQLPIDGIATFSAACAERLFPAYQVFVSRGGGGNEYALRALLSRLWDDLGGNHISEIDLRRAIKECMKLIPGEDTGRWMPEQAWAEDASAAVAYALRCRLSGDAEDAVWSARRAYEALDHYVIGRDDARVGMPTAERKVIGDPLIQAELSRQERDLAELLATNGKEPAAAIVERVRERAAHEGREVFGLLAPNRG